MSDAELILIGGLLLGAGIAAAMVADRVRVPGLILFLGLGMLVGSDGPGGVHFDDVELTRTLGTIGIVLILFEGGLSAGWDEIRPVLKPAISLAIVGTVLTAAIAAVAAGLAVRPRHPRVPDRRRGDRRDRLGGDLRGAARLDAAPAGRADARGRVRPQRPGRGAARHRIHLAARGPRLRDRGHGARLRRGARHRRRRRSARRNRRPVGVRTTRLPDPGPLPGRLDRGGGARVRSRRHQPRVRLPRGLPDRTHAGHRDRPRAAHGHRLPPGTELGRADLAVLPARTARLPEPARRRSAAGDGAGAGADLRRPPDRHSRRDTGRALPLPRAGDAELGGAARGRADLARNIARDRRRRGQRPALQRHLLRRRHLDAAAGIHVRAARPAARPDDRRGGAARSRSSRRG